MSGIFISYRRHDSAGWTGHLSERMEQCFGPDQIFMDIEKIEAGTDFVEAIESAVGSCNILLAVIGPAWLASVDAEGRRRLDNPEDFIRLEIATALKRNVRVIPVLVGGAAMPTSPELPDDLKALTRRQAHELTDNRWDYDTEQLIKFIEKAGIKRMQAAKPETAPQAEPLKKFSGKAIASIVISLLTTMSLVQEDSFTQDMKIGALALALTALGLAGFAFFDTKLNKTKGKVLAIIGLVFSGLILLVDIGLLATPAPSPPTTSTTATPHQAPVQQAVPQAVLPEPLPRQLPAPPPAASTISGIWAGSDGLTYQIQQQGNMVAVIGGYPNQMVMITASGVINGQNIELDYIRTTDNTGGKSRLRISANGRSMQGQYRNLATGETGEMILTR